MKKVIHPFLRCLTITGLFLVAPALPAATHVVQMTGSLTFVPATLAIAKGDTVIWTNVSGITHTSTSGSSCSPDGLWSSGNIAGGGSFKFTFTNLNAGVYPYFCAPHCFLGMTGTLTLTNAANTAPLVSITNPVPGAKFLAPANVRLQASASDADGSVASVQFFSGTTALADVPAAPFQTTASNLGAGNYTFTVRAVDDLGLATTSAPVTIQVLTSATIVNPGAAAGSFHFDVNATAGQAYIAEFSTNLLSWSAFATNVNAAPVISFTNIVGTDERRFYRVRQDWP
jgi:plastocyanin